MINAEEKARAARRAYYKEWRAKNKDKVKANNLRYWTRRAEREALASEHSMKGGVKCESDATVSKNR